MREMDAAMRIEKIRIMNEAGLCCSESDPDYYMFHNPFVGGWNWVDFAIANQVPEIERRTSAAWDEFDRWYKENNPAWRAEFTILEMKSD